MPFSRGLPEPGIEPSSPVSSALAGGFSTTSTTWEALFSLQEQNCCLLNEALLDFLQCGRLGFLLPIPKSSPSISHLWYLQP